MSWAWATQLASLSGTPSGSRQPLGETSSTTIATPLSPSFPIQGSLNASLLETDSEYDALVRKVRAGLPAGACYGASTWAAEPTEPLWTAAAPAVATPSPKPEAPLFVWPTQPPAAPAESPTLKARPVAVLAAQAVAMSGASPRSASFLQDLSDLAARVKKLEGSQGQVSRTLTQVMQEQDKVLGCLDDVKQEVSSLRLPVDVASVGALAQEPREPLARAAPIDVQLLVGRIEWAEAELRELRGELAVQRAYRTPPLFRSEGEGQCESRADEVKEFLHWVQQELQELRRVVPVWSGDADEYRYSLRNLVQTVEADVLKVAAHTDHMERTLETLLTRLQVVEGLDVQDLRQDLTDVAMDPRRPTSGAHDSEESGTVLMSSQGIFV